MRRLIKLAVFAGAAYAIYEVVQGLMSEPRGRRSPGSRPLKRALNSSVGRMRTLAGEGFGQHEQTVDVSGESVPHQVGRGVIVQ